MGEESLKYILIDIDSNEDLTDLYMKDPTKKNPASFYYKQLFHMLNPLKKEDMATLTSEKDGDYFFFVHVPEEEIQDILTINSLLAPIVNISENKELSLIDIEAG